MRKKKSAKPREKGWTYTVGELTAYERKDRGGAIWTRLPGTKKGTYRDRQPLCEPIRNADGAIDQALETKARLLTDNRARNLAAEESSDDKPKAGKNLTLKGAAWLYLHPKQGKFAGESEWKADVRRHLATCINVIGNIDVEGERGITRTHYKSIWRELMHRHLKDPTHNGLRAIEQHLGSLRAMIVWLMEEEHIETAALPSLKWKEAMRKDWIDITKKPIGKPKKPRYTKEEQVKLWAALPNADPRIRLDVELGAELRLGQVVRCCRTDVDPHGERERGALHVHGRGKKHGSIVVFTDDQWAVIEEAMTTGYLSDLEAAYKAGTLADYRLVPGEFLAKGKAQIKNAMALASARAMRNWWKELEELAGVEHIKGRGWYGLRRLGADLAEDQTDDARVLNASGGWTDSKTRSKYQDDGRMDIYEKAADVRALTRPKKAETTPLHDTTETAGI